MSGFESRTRHTRTCSVFFCVLFLQCAVPVCEATQHDSVMERLLAGEVILENSRTDESGGSARVMLLVRSSAERLWNIFMSCDYAFVFVDGLEKCEVLQESAEYVQTRQVVDKGWWVPEMDYIFETRRTPYSHMEFKLLEGNLKTLEGYWDIEPVPEGVLVTYEIRVRPKMPAPRWLVRRTIKNEMPGLVACIRGLAERASVAPGNEQAVNDDLRQCAQEVPGK